MQPLISGVNFIPSGSVAGSLWLFQEYGHKEAFRDAIREIAHAAELEFSSIRMVLPFEVYRQEKEVFFRHLDEFLEPLLGYFGGSPVTPFDDNIQPGESIGYSIQIIQKTGR